MRQILGLNPPCNGLEKKREYFKLRLELKQRRWRITPTAAVHPFHTPMHRLKVDKLLSRRDKPIRRCSIYLSK